MTSPWQADLADFFATIEREDEALRQNNSQRAAFYADTVGPALDAAADALRPYGRECETGTDAERLYLIVRRPGGAVEFQYAVVAEVRIEGVVPYAHCWFEEFDSPTPPDDAQPEKEADDSEEDEEEDEGAEAQKDDKEDDKKPARTKTIEPLGSWTAGRTLESVTRDEVVADFLAHYREAVTRLRAHLHAQPPQAG